MKITLPSALLSLAIALLLGGCASITGSSLVPGKSTSADVQALMGQPKERVDVAGGDKIWFYPHGPVGQQTYAVRLNADGIVRLVEQTLTRENVVRLQSRQVSTAAGVDALLGPPNKVLRFENLQRDDWEYRMLDVNWKVLTLQFSYDGELMEVMYADDPLESIRSGGECQRC